MIGSAVCEHFQRQGRPVARLVRARSGYEPSEGDIAWSPRDGTVDEAMLEGADVVIHLAGESIAGRWSAAKKQRIMESRREGTRTLAAALARLKHKPAVMLSASAIGYYGDRGDELLTEASPAGEGFLAEVCRAWEAATLPAGEAGIRVCHLRFGLVLSPHGGALNLMLTPFKLGLGGKLGSGRQWVSWVHIDDVVGVMHHCVDHAEISGAVNVVAPEPVTNAQFTKTLGRVLCRPTVLPAPAFGLRLLLGEMADEGLLASVRVLPRKLEETHYRFKHPNLEAALRHAAGKHSGGG